MGVWLPVIIVAYLFFSLSFLGDKLILSGPKSAKLYTFYVGVLNVIVIIFLPFTSFTFPDVPSMVFAVLESIVYLLGLYTMFMALEKFDVSVVTVNIGALQPIMILALTWIFFGFNAMTLLNYIAFAMLCLGSVIISIKKSTKVTGVYLGLALFSSFMFSLDYIFTKMVFLHQSFFEGIILMRMLSFLLVFLFLFDKNLRAQVFVKPSIGDKKTGLLFLSSQSAGGMAGLLQSLAIALAPVGYLAIINSLRGVQYVFLFIITLFFSVFFPKILQEDLSKTVILQKVVSMVLIVSGLAMLTV